MTASGSRVANTKRNVIFSYVEIIISLVFAFVSRSIIVYTLGDEYLGLTSLFVSILQVLSMAELGFSSAIIYNMYAPVAEGSVEKVCALLNYYRKVYRTVGLIVLGAGLALMPFLRLLIKDEIPADMNLYLLYILFLLNTGISYFVFAYKAALLEALQRMDLTKLAYSVVTIAQQIAQILCLILWKNYYVYVALMIVGTAMKNLLAGRIADRKFPEYTCRGEITQETKKDIFSRVKGLLVCNVSQITYTTLDSIILSSFAGLTAVAVYNNYLTICTYVMNFITMIRWAMQASVGNSIAVESREKNYHDMLLWQFLFAVIATWCVTCMTSLYQPFISLWMGPERLLSMTDVILLCLWFYCITSQHSVFLYLSGNGMWWEMRWPYILSTVCNLVMNIVLGKIWGVTGIIFATVFATFVFGYVWQCTIVFRKYFGTGLKDFYLRNAGYFLVCCLSAGAAYLVNQALPLGGYGGLFVKLFICTAVSALAVFLAYRKLEIFRTAVGFIRRLFNM